MPLFPPSEAVSHAIDLIRRVDPIRALAWLSALLGGNAGGRTGQLSGEGLTPDQCETLALMVYWFHEYLDHRISPVALVEVLTNLLAVINKEQQRDGIRTSG
jgi:hypothetical protein